MPRTMAKPITTYDIIIPFCSTVGFDLYLYLEVTRHEECGENMAGGQILIYIINII